MISSKRNLLSLLLVPSLVFFLGWLLLQPSSHPATASFQAKLAQFYEQPFSYVSRSPAPDCHTCSSLATLPDSHLCKVWGAGDVARTRAYEGSGVRSRRFWNRILAGEVSSILTIALALLIVYQPIHAVVIGGSVSKGHGLGRV